LFHLLLLIYEDEPELCVKMLKNVLNETMEILLTIIKTSSDKTSRGLKREALKILEVLIKNIPKELKGYSKDILSAIFESMIEEYKLYYEYNIIESKDPNDLYDQELGESLKLNILIIQQLELISTIIGTHLFKNLLNSQAQERIIQLCILYSQFTQEEEEIWEDDPNAYISQNDEESLALTVRLLSQEIVQEICVSHKGSYQYVFKHMIENFKESEKKKQKNEKDWWKLREASLYCLGTISNSIKNQNLNIEGLLKNLIDVDLKGNMVPSYLKSTR
jgi:importin-9